MASITISRLVNELVERHGPQGVATEKVQELQAQLETRLEAASDECEKQRVLFDLEYVKGYLETPATLLADLKKHKPRRKR